MGEETERFETMGMIVGPVLEESLDDYMMKRDVEALDRKLGDLKAIKPISSIMLINRDGLVKVSTDKTLLETSLAEADLRCRRCHEPGKRWIIMRDKAVFRWIQPVRNKIECTGCHDPAHKNNGVFIIDFSLAELETHVSRDLLSGILIFGMALAVSGVISILLSKSLVGTRLGAIIQKIRRFKDGDYSTRIPPEGSDEITELTVSFNEMADSIAAREREKDILFKQVSRSQKEWQNTFDSITDLISIHDGEFNIIRANKAFSEYFGVVPGEVINKKCHEFFHASGLPSEGCPHKITMKEGKPVVAELANPVTGRTFRIATFPFHFEEAEFQGTIHIARDITDEKEKELRLIISERLASLGQMAAGIAHEINNPLAAIAGCAEGLLGRVKKDKFDRELFENYLKIIEEEILRCKNITTGMLSFARKATYDRKELSINEAVDKTLEIIGFQGRLHGVRVTKDYSQSLPHVRGSEGELRQVFLAIMTNALDAMEDEGTLTVSTGTEDGKVVVSIGDTGPGLAPEVAEKIFDPFFTTKSDRGGTGLGLSIAGKIISGHGGGIRVISERGKGATFKISLPAA